MRDAGRFGLALLLLACGAGAACASAASGLLYERTVMSAAGARCGLFQPDVADALAAARVQARGAALRAGDGEGAVAAVEQRARDRAASVDCRAKGLQTAAERVRAAFTDYARLSVMRFPGAQSAWRAERPDPRLTGPRWRLVQALPGTGGWVLFGSVSGRAALLDARRGVAAAASARILLRDPARLASPYLPGRPPPGATRTVIASERGPAVRALLPAGADAGVLYSFPPELLDALSALDPRETAEVELVYPSPGRDRVVAAALEIGDLAAARAFLAIRPPPAATR